MLQRKLLFKFLLKKLTQHIIFLFIFFQIQIQILNKFQFISNCIFSWCHSWM